MPGDGQCCDPFAALGRHEPRRFVPEDIDLGEAAQVVALCEKLLARKIDSAADLERWLLDSSELESALDQHGAILYIRMTCQTDDPQRASLIFRGSVDVRVPLVGGKIESFIATQLVDLLIAEQRFTTAWLAGNT